MVPFRQLLASFSTLRIARLLANRQAKKEYDQYKQEYQERQKQQGKNVEGGYFESDSDSNISEAPKESEEEEESSEEESEVESSESDDVVPKIKPVFTRKKDRYTLEVEDDVNQRTKEIEERKEKTAEERRGWTLKIRVKILKTSVVFSTSIAWKFQEPSFLDS